MASARSARQGREGCDSRRQLRGLSGARSGGRSSFRRDACGPLLREHPEARLLAGRQATGAVAVFARPEKLRGCPPSVWCSPAAGPPDPAGGAGGLALPRLHRGWAIGAPVRRHVCEVAGDTRHQFLRRLSGIQPRRRPRRARDRGGNRGRRHRLRDRLGECRRQRGTAALVRRLLSTARGAVAAVRARH